MSGDTPVTDRARAWLADDPDPVTRAELDALLTAADAGDAAAQAALAERFAGRLAFGTAGIRAELGAGPMRMNRVVVAQAAAGLAAHLIAGSARTARTGDAPAPVVVGYDGRHNSAVFARDVAAVLAGAGLAARLLPRALPTPVLAFCVRHLDAAAGVMITASHNPPRDNGMKVYLGGPDGGAQIVPPADGEIAAQIARAAAVPFGDVPRAEDYLLLGDDIVEAYVRATAAAARPAAPLRFVYSAMHGVGWDATRRVLAAAGFSGVIPVPEQVEPDADFPTVAFPNPEEPGAMDLTLALAAAEDADLAIVHDPDADRLAVAIPGADGWRRLTGDEVGLLLGWEAARAATAVPRRDGEAAPGLACSLVSSPGLGLIAAHFGLDHTETLTGFKWISRVPGLVYGYEEALGYLVNPEQVRDKDGISAAIAFLGLASRLQADGRDIEDALDEIAEAIGGHASAQASIRVDDLTVIARIGQRLRTTPPESIAGRAVVRVRDYLDDPAQPADILRYDLADGSRVILRPSGTEPKLKAYLNARSDEGPGRQRRRDAMRIVAELEHSAGAMLG